MTPLTDRLWAVFVLIAMLYGAWGYASAWTEASTTIERTRNGRDFASYYLAAHALDAGLDPYSPADLRTVGKELGRPRGAHPFFYPPPFLPIMAWTRTLDLHTAYARWAVFDALCAVSALLALGLWWRRLHPLAPALLALLLGGTTAIPNNHIMGQANHLVLLLVVLGLWAEARERQTLAGVLIGAACMAKMSPALFVLWWMVRGRWRAVGAALGFALVSSVITLLWVPAAIQIRFYTEVLPGFANGSYNGLAVPIDLFGNHSVANVFNAYFPSGSGVLSPTARWGTRGVGFALLATMAWRFRAPMPDPIQRAAQVSCIAVAMLLLPVYTYEHHLVWALPAIAVMGVGVATRRVSPLWGVVVFGAAVVVMYDLQELKRWSRGSAYGYALQESKFLALCALAMGTAWLGGVRSDQGTTGVGISHPDQVVV